MKESEEVSEWLFGKGVANVAKGTHTVDRQRKKERERKKAVKAELRTFERRLSGCYINELGEVVLALLPTPSLSLSLFSLYEGIKCVYNFDLELFRMSFFLLCTGTWSAST